MISIVRTLCFTALFTPMITLADAFVHTKEIGLSHVNKKTEFVRDNDMLSPKSLQFVKDTLYINALEKGKTLVYSSRNWEKMGEISHDYNKPEFVSLKNFPYTLNGQKFMGKPVEMVFNFDGTKAWIPYYRLSWDTYSRHHSAIAQVNLKTLEVEKLIPSGSIPKMVALSHDNRLLVSSHWGDNTVGIYSLDNHSSITQYHYVEIGKKLDISKISGDRDKYCGYCLRGTVFTPDDKYILVSRMGGGGIAVIDAQEKKYLGVIQQVPLTPRHLVVQDNTLYISTVASGEVAKISMHDIYEDIEALKSSQKSKMKISQWQTIKLGSGIRTIAVSKDNQYIYAAMNTTSELAIIDNQTMKLKHKYKVASFPVGLAVSDDDRWIALTAQGKAGLGGGNHIDVFERLK